MDRMDEDVRIAFRNRLENSLSILNAQIERLRLRYSEMEAKSKEYFEKVVECLVNMDEERAKIYAEEIVEIKKLAEIVKKSQLLLLQVKIRLETIVEITEVIGLIVPLTSLLTEVEDELKPIAPEIVQNLHELSVCIEEFTATTVYNKLEPVKYGELSKEAEKILLEAQRNAVEIVKNKFPDIPTLNENEIKIYAYISKNGGEIDLKKCSEELKLDVKEIKSILASLEEKGLIEVEGA
jgi:division protein CdvB (Snf7/Vps24/ESCRT-III family)